MAYSNAIFYVDYINGSDTARTALTSCTASNPSGTTTRINKTGHGLVTGAVVDLTAFSAWLNSAWKITKVDNDNFDLDGAVWQTTADASGTVTPRGGSSWTDAWKNMGSPGATAARIADGDIIKIAQSPPPTSLGQSALWTGTSVLGGGLEATKAISAMANNGSGAIRLTVASQTWTTGDIIQITGLVTTGTTYEANGLWVVTVINSTTVDLDGSTFVNTRASGGSAQKINSKCVLLTTPVTLALENCEADWTPGAQTTSSLRDATDWKEGGAAIKIITAATCNANQIIAKKATLSTANLSGYQQISFWIKNTTSALAAGDLQVRLYSDAACTSLQETLSIPAIASTGRWVPITIDKGSAMYNGIQGIAVYTTVQFNSKTLYIDNLIACKAASSADSLSLQSLISKNTTLQGSDTSVGYANEAWYAIQSIGGQGTTNSGRIVVLDNGQNTLANAGRGYSGATETVPTYKRETIKTTMVASSGTAVQAIDDSGVAGRNIEFQGGYDTATGLQTGESFYDGLNGYGSGIYITSKSYVTLNLLSVCRYTYGLYLNATTRLTIGTITNLNNNSSLGYFTGNDGFTTINCILNANNNDSSGLYIASYLSQYLVIGSAHNNLSTGINPAGMASCLVTTIRSCNNNGAYGFQFTQGSGNTVGTIDEILRNSLGGIGFSTTFNNTVNTISNCSYNSTAGVVFTSAAGNIIKNLTTSGHSSSGISFAFGFNYILKATIGELNKAATSSARGDTRMFIDDIGGYSNIWCDNGNIVSQDATAGGTGLEWKLSPTNTARDVNYPIELSVTKVAVTANSQVTVSLYFKKSHATDIAARLLCKGSQVAGEDSDVYTVCPDDTNRNLVTITLDPTESGVVEILAQAWWVANTADESVIIDDITITQA